jgi:hypothetical protein
MTFFEGERNRRRVRHLFFSFKNAWQIMSGHGQMIMCDTWLRMRDTLLTGA